MRFQGWFFCCVFCGLECCGGRLKVVFMGGFGSIVVKRPDALSFFYTSTRFSNMSAFINNLSANLKTFLNFCKGSVVSLRT
jgi:hypothetical protein